jgi:DNA polymerase (family 10)
MTTNLCNYEFEIFKKFSSHETYPIAEEWLERLKSLPVVLGGEISGELRRGKYSIDHIELVLAVANPAAARSSILDALYPHYIQEESEESITLLLPSGIKVIIWLAAQSQFACKLLLTTGSENHLAQLTRLATINGLTINHAGFLEADRPLDIQNEEGIYAALGLPWIPPELRESGEEVEDVQALDLVNLIQISDILSDLHVHSTWSDGKNSITEMAETAKQRGFTHMAICDHSPLLMKKYSDASYFSQQAIEIEDIQQKLQDRFTIMKGVEVDIMPDGSLNLPDELLKKMDIVVASMHVALDQPIEEATARLIRAIENPYVNIIGHPGGRIYPMVDVMDLDWERVCRAAAFNQVALEINSHKSHPIFDDKKSRLAASLGVPIAIDSDSHSTEMMTNSRYGIAIARRAGLKRDQVINTWSLAHLKLWLRHKRELISKAQ